MKNNNKFTLEMQPIGYMKLIFLLTSSAQSS